MNILSKLFPCKHPLDKVKLVSTTKKKASSTHYDHTETYVCTKCEDIIVKKFETMTEEHEEFVRGHIGDIEASLFFGVKVK